MMQQVAAQNTDSAALPFATSKPAKAVEAGISAESRSQNNQAFQQAFDDARLKREDLAQEKKLARRDSLEQEQNLEREESLQRQESLQREENLQRKENRELQASTKNNAENASKSSAKPEQDKAASHQVSDDETKGAQQAALDDQDNLAQSEKSDAANQPLIDSTDESSLIGELDNSDVTQDASEDSLFSGESELSPEKPTPDALKERLHALLNGEKQEDTFIRADLPVKSHLVTDDEVNTENENATRWIDYVDAVLAAKGEGKSANAETGETNPQVATFDELLNEDGAMADNAYLAEMLEALNAEASASMADGDKPHLLGEEVLSITQQLMGELTQDNDEVSDEALATLKALTAVIQDTSSENATWNTELDALLAQFSSVSTDLNGDPALTDAETLSLASLSEDEVLVLSLMKDALAQLQQTDGVKIPESATADPKAMGSENEVLTPNLAELEGTWADELTNMLASMSPESAQKATEAIAQRLAASVPSATQAQQEAIKTSIAAGINEYQQQIAQGREPGIDLQSIIDGAANEAGLSSAQMQQLNAQTEAQVGQFMQLVNQTQGAAHQALQSQMMNVDTQLVENGQLKSEASKQQQQFEGFDKAVNIHKPEGQQQLNEKIRWMVNARNTMAEIRLDPPELGSMQVRVNVSGDAASVSFVVQSQQAKDALADAMPRLKEMLAEQGLELGDAEVRKDNSSQSGESGQQLAGSGNGQQNGDEMSDGADDTHVVEQAVTRQAKGGIDYYA
ncbi:flagellar hook-length control protein FliK [Alteromonas australica]|uniref:Flagellar hook-length control protein-like C-terminal domain-containing protein n=1 Tax=Alteromonas australica TaxID=589873 RepID=A0A075NXG6_9ALTE|nr:flagellar hook-length control protein FliK [Alteromonas australica]AIF98153.1 hypothetical protein EP13_05235 [Alteromonas australica]